MAAPYSEIAKSKLSSANGNLSASPWMSGNRRSNSFWKLAAVASCAAELSIPTGCPPRRANHAET